MDRHGERPGELKLYW